MQVRQILFGAILTLFILWLNIVLWAGEYFDKKCVKGRFNLQHVQAIESVGWNNKVLEENDRAINHKCSEFLRKIYLRDIKESIW